MTRRELTDAVVAAARNLESFAPYDPRGSVPSLAILATNQLNDSIRALDACTEPDLVALNAKVAEATQSALREAIADARSNADERDAMRAERNTHSLRRQQAERARDAAFIYGKRMMAERDAAILKANTLLEG